MLFPCHAQFLVHVLDSHQQTVLQLRGIELLQRRPVRHDAVTVSVSRPERSTVPGIAPVAVPSRHTSTPPTHTDVIPSRRRPNAVRQRASRRECAQGRGRRSPGRTSPSRRASLQRCGRALSARTAAPSAASTPQADSKSPPRWSGRARRACAGSVASPGNSYPVAAWGLPRR
jgi:hypothetical protein